MAIPAVQPASFEQQARIRAIVAEHTGFVLRTLRKAGIPTADLDDEVQRTFIIMANRLESVHLGAERSFLGQVARNVAAHAHRARARRRETFNERPPESIEEVATPEYFIHRKQLRKYLDEIVGSMSESLRSVFELSEFDDMKLSDIAASLGVPRGTVASRLRRARAHFRNHVAAIELAWDLGAEGASQIEGPGLLRQGQATALECALYGAGTSTPASPSMYAKTLAVLGFSRQMQIAAQGTP